VGFDGGATSWLPLQDEGAAGLSVEGTSMPQLSSSWAVKGSPCAEPDEMADILSCTRPETVEPGAGEDFARPTSSPENPLIEQSQSKVPDHS
jgi:hypothetical protein